MFKKFLIVLILLDAYLIFVKKQVAEIEQSKLMASAIIPTNMRKKSYGDCLMIIRFHGAWKSS